MAEDHHRDRAIAHANAAQLLLEDALRAEPESHLAPNVLVAAGAAFAQLALVHLQLSASKPDDDDAKTTGWPHPVGKR